ncbi:DUF1579 family protein [Flavitalea flava]
MKKMLLITLISVAEWTGIPAVAQEKISASKQVDTVSGQNISRKNDIMKQLLAFSAPGKQHMLLADLVGSWIFQDQKLAFVKGKVIRKQVYDGRFFTVEITGGKLQIPVAAGMMKEENYQSMQIEGYDNPRAAFVTISINNHIGSDIEMQTGTYDINTKVITYDWDSELIPGVRTKNRRLLRIADKDHYIEEFFELRNNVPVKVRELDYTRVNGG